MPPAIHRARTRWSVPLPEIQYLILAASGSKVRIEGTVRDGATLKAIGIRRDDGKRMILGVGGTLCRTAPRPPFVLPFRQAIPKQKSTAKIPCLDQRVRDRHSRLYRLRRLQSPQQPDQTPQLRRRSLPLPGILATTRHRRLCRNLRGLGIRRILPPTTKRTEKESQLTIQLRVVANFTEKVLLSR